MTKRLLHLVMLAVAVLSAAPVHAQQAQPTPRQGRPTRGLFGGGTGNTDQQLVFSSSVGGGYDWDNGGPMVAADGTTTPSPRWTGSFAMGTANLSYDVSRSRISAGATVGTSARYNPNQSGSLMRSVGAGAHAAAKLSDRSSISVSHSISRQPFNLQRLYGTGLEAGFAPDVLFDLGGALSDQNLFSAQTAVSASYSLSSRLAASAGYQHGFNRFGASAGSESRTHTGVAGISYSIFRGARLRVGYSQTSTQFGASAPITTGGLALDGGLTFDRAISLTRRTFFTFATGVTGAKDELSRTHYFLTGNAALRHEIGRSWTASVNYRRGVDFNLGLNQPVIIDTASVGVGGVLGRRLQLSASGGAVWGALGVGPGARDYTIGSFNSSARVALTKVIGIAGSYNFRRSEFADPATLPVGFRPMVERHSVRITLDLWLPLIMTARRDDASR